MASFSESLVTTDGSEQSPWNVCFWDVSTGAVQSVFKGGLSGQGCLSMVGSSYLLSAQQNKPLLQAWELNRKEQVHQRMILPGKVTSLCVCPLGNYCVAAIGESFHLWMVSSGELLAVVTRHFQPITCIVFTSDSSYFLTAGEDGYIYLWDLASVLRPDGPTVEPFLSYPKHAMQVTNLVIGCDGINGNFASVSHDHTCRVYSLISGEIYVSFVMETALTSVTFDPAEYHLYTGDVHGSIYQIELFKTPPAKDIHLSDEEKREGLFSGHLKQVTSLCTSMDGSLLCSGSYDHSARLWHVASRQCLRVIPHKGAVLNAFFTLTPPGLSRGDSYKAYHLLATFQRQLGSVSAQRNTATDYINGGRYELMYSNKSAKSNQYSTDAILQSKGIYRAGESKAELQDTISSAKRINHQLYNYTVEHLLTSLDDSSSN